jgi:hypothetical protein
MTKTAWHDLPNALHIDRILADLQCNYLAWYAARDAAAEAVGDAARDAARYAAWYAARDAARDAARYAAWYAASDAARDAARLVAWDAARDAAGDAAGSAISALIAWDDSAKFLDMTPDQLRFWIKLSDDPKAILLLPAVVALAPELAMA